MCASFGDSTSRDRELRHTKNGKKRLFLGRKLINLICKAENLTQHGRLWMLSEPNLGAPGHVTVILQVKNEQKLDEVVPIYLGKYRYW